MWQLRKLIQLPYGTYFRHKRNIELRQTTCACYSFVQQSKVSKYSQYINEGHERNEDSSKKSSDGTKRSLTSLIWAGAGIALIYSWKDIAATVFTVHAAKPVEHEYNDYEKRFASDLEKDSSKSRRRDYNVIADVVDETANAVVCIHVGGIVSDWFGGAHRTESNGSGFIVSPEGLIVTNAHVVDSSKNPTSIKVTMHNNRTYSGRVIAVDPMSDLALLQIDAKNLPFLKLGSSSDTRLGERVVAIGSPLSLANSVTTGVVSSLNREGQKLGLQNNLNYIQTDAAITFGNSGGPLVNLDGEVIGVNTMTVTSGISFAIPSDHVNTFIKHVEELRKTGRLKRRRYLGITLMPLTEDVLAHLQYIHGFNSYTRNGVLVMKVVVGSPAYLAGMQPGDVIEKINGKTVLNTRDISDIFESNGPLQLIVARGNRRYQCVIEEE